MNPVLYLVLAARVVMAALVPLTADEAYYWLWSKHLDWGYLDHPPLIAWLIRAGTMLLGDSVLGVRASGIILSAVATLFVWEAARTLLKNETRAAVAALLFNLTLMIGVEMLAATPDMPSIATSAALLFCLARIQVGPPPLRARSALAGEVVVAGPSGREAKGPVDLSLAGPSEDRRGPITWWLWAGLAAGLSLLSKYSAFFLLAGAFLWLLLSPRARGWLRTPWPWSAALLALLIFLPNLIWQTNHDWETFAFQFGRIVGHQWTGRYLLEFLGAQLGLASPFVFILGVAGLVRARRSDDLFLPAMLIWPAAAYFLLHALHDRVQGNWPGFLYPAFAILAVAEFADTGWRKWCSRLAAPVAAGILILIYAQALTGFIPLGSRDPLARLIGVGFRPVADSLVGAARVAHAGAILTTDYETTAWLRFYEPGLKVVQLGETYRYPAAPMPEAALMRAPLLYFVEGKRDQSARLRKYFSSVLLATQLRIGRADSQTALYEIYLVDMPKGPVPGRMP
jgi:4-amino-4-deoxy-L-arabinose transferase-like glycosyltransferase